MCGIAGILAAGADDALAADVERMTRRLRHRGPDAAGTHVDGPVALGHARLSIIDLSEGGAQPMHSPDGRHTLVYNGELYNFRELRAELEAAGTVFRSASDTEVVLHAALAWGVAGACRRFNGMFAFALWDRAERRLSLARDRFGIKPLYWSRHGRRLLFGSEIKALGTCPDFERRLDEDGLAEYLYYGNALRENTLFAGCRKLLPGHLLEARPGEAPVERAWWTLADVPPAPALPEGELVERVREALEGAVARHLVADVPVALFLSGGLDSSSICALAAGAYGGTLRTVSVEFEGETSTSELAAARLVAETFGTAHEERRLTYSNLVETLDALAEAHDQPFGDAANVPLYILARDVAGDARVVLQGDGGDEIFGGYRRYGLLRRARAWRAFARLAPVPRALAGRIDAARRLRRMQDALGARDGAERFARLLTEEWEDGGIGALLRPEARARLAGRDPFAAYRAVWPEVAGLDPAQGMLHTDTRVILPDIFLEKVDRATMASGVEVRVPFLDTELADLVMGLPSELKLAGRSKSLLRRAMAGTLPPEILDGPKLGFGVPYGEWLAGPLAGFVRERLTAPGQLVTDLFDPARLERLCARHARREANHGFMLYKLLMLALWSERHGVR